MNRYIKFGIVLFGVCLFASSALSFVYMMTASRIQAQEKQIAQQALKEVFAFDDSMVMQSKTTASGNEYDVVYASSLKKVIVGYIINAVGKGYSGDITIIAGTTKEGVITGMRVLQQSETPGLGARCVEIEKTQTVFDVITGKKQVTVNKVPWFMQRFETKNVKTIKIVKNTPIAPDEIQAITGATITSKAIVDAVKHVAQEILAR